MKTPLLFFSLALFGTLFHGFSQELPQISVVGQSEIQVMPDQAMLTVTLRAKAMETVTATAELNKKAKEVTMALENSGLSGYELTAENYYVNVHRVYVKGSSRDSGYVASQTLKVLVRDTGDKLLSIVQTLHGATDLGFQLSYQLSAEKKKRYAEELVRLAIADARRKAEAIAGALDIEDIFVHRVTYQGGESFEPVLYRAKGMRMESDEAAVPPTLQPGEQTLSERVQIVYTFTQKAP
ncbi:SIMPL domain-containing protein [Cyclobacterium xiamenense]|uniref:SIMPL domain-containing protein n=1 Tax=Cyclobacterium xiamenense TaxID=1297121 RepID=UPI0035CF3525